MKETGGETACMSANSYELVSEMKSLGNNDQERSWSFCQARFMKSGVSSLCFAHPMFCFWTLSYLDSNTEHGAKETCASLRRNTSMFFCSCILPVRPPQQPVPLKTCWLKWAGRCAASPAWIQSLSELNLSPFPLINEWLEEAESWVAEPIYWRTFGAVKSVRLITVNHPEVFALNHRDPKANSSEEI